MSGGKTISVRIPSEVHRALERMCRKNGEQLGTILSDAVMLLLRARSVHMEASPDVLEAWALYEDVWGTGNACNFLLLDPGKVEIMDAIYRVRRTGRGKPVLMMMGKPFMSERYVSVCRSEILTVVMRSLYPTMYKALEAVATERRLPDIGNALCWMLNEYTPEALRREVQDLFDLSDEGARVLDGKSAPHYQIDERDAEEVERKKEERERRTKKDVKGRFIQTPDMFQALGEDGDGGEG